MGNAVIKFASQKRFQRKLGQLDGTDFQREKKNSRYCSSFLKIITPPKWGSKGMYPKVYKDYHDLSEMSNGFAQ